MPFNGNSILVMDHASIHHVDSVIEVIEEVGCLLLFLPPYSPDHNPIEECFSKIKSQLRSSDPIAQEIPIDGFPDLIMSAFDTVSAEDSHGWFKDGRYNV